MLLQYFFFFPNKILSVMDSLVGIIYPVNNTVMPSSDSTIEKDHLGVAGETQVLGRAVCTIDMEKKIMSFTLPLRSVS